jgi:hypothetical protein
MKDENGAIAEMVRQGILKAREKLIDLSLRNGMLNYRHSESSSHHVRVVHQLPGAVVECLASEKSIDLLPLPPVETIPRDEDTDVFRAALKEAKRSIPNGLQRKTRSALRAVVVAAKIEPLSGHFATACASSKEISFRQTLV